MSCAVIGIGGTGARCVETLIHLCAAGLGPEELYILLVDSDEANGNIVQVRETIKQYQEVRKMHIAERGEGKPFRTRFYYGENNDLADLVWSPKRVSKESTLNRFLQFDNWPKWMDVCRTFYAEADLDLEWDDGYRGRPSISSLVIGSCLEKAFLAPPWSILEGMITSRLSSQHPQFTFTFASAFGAAGAGGFPAVGLNMAKRAKLQKWQGLENFHLGGCLVLPYFTFNVTPELQKKPYADPKYFRVNAKSALLHYSESRHETEAYESVYLVGCKNPDRVDREDRVGRGRAEAGGSKQVNPMQPIELVSALAALHFYESKNESSSSEGKTEHIQNWWGARPTDDARLGWKDLPDIRAGASETENLRLVRCLGSMLTAFAVYREFFYPLVVQGDFEKNRSLITWYNNFEPDSLSNPQAAVLLKSLMNYSERFLSWMYQVHGSESYSVELFDKSTLDLLNRTERAAGGSEVNDSIARAVAWEKSQLSDKRALLYPSQFIFDSMCFSEREKDVTEGVHHFWSILYEGAKEYVSKRYKLPLREN